MARFTAVAVAVLLFGGGLTGLKQLGGEIRAAADTQKKLADSRASPAGDLDPHDEPTIAISPVDNRIMVAASKVIVGGNDDPIRSVSRVAYYSSSDAGSTWASRR